MTLSYYDILARVPHSVKQIMDNNVKRIDVIFYGKYRGEYNFIDMYEYNFIEMYRTVVRLVLNKEEPEKSSFTRKFMDMHYSEEIRKTIETNKHGTFLSEFLPSTQDLDIFYVEVEVLYNNNSLFSHIKFSEKTGGIMMLFEDGHEKEYRGEEADNLLDKYLDTISIQNKSNK